MITFTKWFAYHQWGTRRQLEHLATMPGGVYSRVIKSVFPTIRHVFEHVWVVDYLWLKRMQGNPQPDAPSVAFETIQETMDAFEQLHAEMASFLDGVEDPEKTLDVITMKGIHVQNTIEEMVYTVVNHGSYHRGNVTAMHRQQGYPGTPYDYFYYVKEEKKKTGSAGQ